MQGSTYSAEVLRRSMGTLLARGGSIGSILGGLVGSTDCQVTAGSGMQIAIGPGEMWVPGSSAATQSGYYSRVSSSTTLTIATSDPSNPRIDRVSGVIVDKAYSGVTESFAVAVETGTPTAGATLVNLSGVAAAPASSLTLGYVLVPAGSVSISGGNISNVASQFTSPFVPGWRPIRQVTSQMIAGNAAGTWFPVVAAGAKEANVSKEVNYGTSLPEVFFINPIDYAIAGRTTFFKIKYNVFINGTAPSSNFTAGLFQLTGITGGENLMVGTYGGLLSGSEAKFGSLPAKEAGTTVESGNFTLSNSAAQYAIGFINSAPIAAKSLVDMTAQLFVVNI